MTDPLKVGVAKNLASFRVDYFLNLLIFKGFSPDSPVSGSGDYAPGSVPVNMTETDNC